MDHRSSDTGLRFTGIDEARDGALVSLLRCTYAHLLETDAARWAPESGKWSAFDRMAFSSPAVGRCVFLTWHGDALVGFGSFDPRGAPHHVRVGHHCILPTHQGRGMGQAQLREVLRRVHAFAPRAVDAFTLDLPFFAPARRLYASTGFRLVDPPAGSRRVAGVARLHLRKPIPPPM